MYIAESQTALVADGMVDPIAGGARDGWEEHGSSKDQFAPALPNAPPAGLDGSINFYEDAVLTLNDPIYFGYSDSDGDAFGGVWIDSTSGSGAFTLNGVALTVPVFVTAAQVAAGNLRFTPASNVSGNNYAEFTFRVTDSAGGVDPVANTRALNILPVNDAPTITNLVGDSPTYTEDLNTSMRIDLGSNATVTDPDSGNFNGGSLTIALTAGQVTRDRFGIFQDGPVTVSGANVSVNGVLIGTVTGVGTAGGPLVVTFTTDDATAARVEILLQKIFYGSNTQQNPVSGTRTFTTTLTDGDGGSTSAVSSMVVIGVNDAPAGTNSALTINEDQPLALTIANFGFDDHALSSQSEGQSLLAVIITSLPAGGTLYIDTDGVGTGALGTAVFAGQSVSAVDIAAGRLVYVPATNANGTGAAAFTFQVQDNGGSANGGADTGQSANTLTFNVTAVNDVPVNIVPAAQTGAIGSTIVFSTATGNVLTISDPDAGAGSVRVKVATDHGTLTLSSTAGLTVSGNGTGLIKITGTLADINAALNGLTLQGEAGYTGPATLILTHNDLGGGGSGGQLIDKDRITINWQGASQDALKSGDTFALADLGSDLAGTSVAFDFWDMTGAGLQGAVTARALLDVPVQPELVVWHDPIHSGSDFLL
jgi:Bacterial cadherin-like domain